MRDDPTPMHWLARGEHALPVGTHWLAPAEAARAAGLHHTKRRTEYLLRRLVAKHGIATVTGQPTDPATLAGIEVRNAPSGAPYVLVEGVPLDLDLSITDRAGWAVCVLGGPAGLNEPVGCDLELVEPRSAGFVRDFLTGAEQRFVASRPAGEERDVAVNLIWSAKESALKVLRVGLGRDTRSVEVAVSVPGTAGWGALCVRSTEGGVFPGWWRREGRFLLTLAAAATGPPPVALAVSDVLATAAPRALLAGAAVTPTEPAVPRFRASTMYGRSSAAAMIRSTEPTASARCTVWIRSNSSATSPSFADRTVAVVSARRVRNSPAVDLGRGAEPIGRLAYLWVVLRAGLHLAGEDGGRGWRAADHRGERALDGRDLQAFVERLGEHDERPTVVAGDHHEDDRAAEVGDRPADLRAVLELPAAHRLR